MGSLDTLLHDLRVDLSWSKPLGEAAIGVARALSYLHAGVSTNIMCPVRVAFP